MPERRPFTKLQDRKMYRFLIDQLRNGNEDARSPKGLRIWKKFVRVVHSSRTASNLASHFRKMLFLNPEDGLAKREDVVLYLKQVDINVSANMKQRLEHRYGGKIKLTSQGRFHKWKNCDRPRSPSPPANNNADQDVTIVSASSDEDTNVTQMAENTLDRTRVMNNLHKCPRPSCSGAKTPSRKSGASSDKRADVTDIDSESGKETNVPSADRNNKEKSLKKSRIILKRRNREMAPRTSTSPQTAVSATDQFIHDEHLATVSNETDDDVRMTWLRKAHAAIGSIDEYSSVKQGLQIIEKTMWERATDFSDYKLSMIELVKVLLNCMPEMDKSAEEEARKNELTRVVELLNEFDVSSKTTCVFLYPLVEGVDYEKYTPDSETRLEAVKFVFEDKRLRKLPLIQNAQIVLDVLYKERIIASMAKDEEDYMWNFETMLMLVMQSLNRPFDTI